MWKTELLPQWIILCSRLPFRCFSERLPFSAACASITNPAFSERQIFRRATLQKSYIQKATENDLLPLWRKKVLSPFASQFFVVQTSVKIFSDIYTPSQLETLRAPPVFICSIEIARCGVVRGHLTGLGALRIRARRFHKKPEPRFRSAKLRKNGPKFGS
jgi:hypothetical protein